MAKKMTYKQYTTERCYKQHTPPQIAFVRPALTGVHITHDLPAVECVCGKTFNPKFLDKHLKEKCQGRAE